MGRASYRALESDMNTTSVSDFSHAIPGYRLDCACALDGMTTLTVLNEVTGERFAVEGLSVEQLATPQLCKQIAENLTVHVAGFPVAGIIRLRD